MPRFSALARRPPSTLLPVLALTFNAFVWGTSWWPLRRLEADGLHPLWATAFIFALAATVIAALRPRAIAQVWRTPALWVLVFAAGATNAAFNWAVVIGDVVRVVLLFYLMPLWTVLLARLLLEERLTAHAGLRVALGIAGAATVLWPPHAEGLAALPIPRTLADGLGLLGGFSFALNNVMLRREAARPEEGRALAMFVGGALVAGALATGLALHDPTLWPPTPAPRWLWLALALAALFLAGNLSLQYGAARLTANRTAVVMLTEVLFASVSALLIGGAAPTASLLVGGGLIVLAAMLAALEPGHHDVAHRHGPSRCVPPRRPAPGVTMDLGKETGFGGRVVMVGFGSIGQGVLPLLLRHIDLRADRILIIRAHPDGSEAADTHGVPSVVTPLTEDNYRHVLEPHLGAGDFLLNVSVGVSSAALIALCQERGALYLDTSIEPWAGGYIDPARAPAERTNYALREAVLALRRPGAARPTALLTHGANPGLVSYFVKQALLDIAADTGAPAAARPDSRADWAHLAERLGVRVIHVAERDSQQSAQRKQAGEFVNTWSVDALVDESMQPAELGWGTHERHFPTDGRRHQTGCHAAIYLNRPGADTRVRTWTPLAGPIHGFLITHAESISIAEHLTLGDPERPTYRPTVHYAYHPCDAAVLSLHELAGANWHLQPRKRVIRDDIVTGRDELGVLLMGHARGAYWYGSRLAIDEARALCPCNSATTLQVGAAVVAGMVWAIRNPARGLVEPDDLPFDEVLTLCRPYLGDVVGVYSGWTPLVERERLFDEDLDRADAWQFKNFRVR